MPAPKCCFRDARRARVLIMPTNTSAFFGVPADRPVLALTKSAAVCCGVAPSLPILARGARQAVLDAPPFLECRMTIEELYASVPNSHTGKAESPRLVERIGHVVQ